jgi:tetratricopeptide (TPR) repeat protein
LEPVTFKSLIEIEGKHFILETSSMPGRPRYSYYIQVDGRIISQKESDFPDGLNEEGMKSFLQNSHKARAVELESIFRLNRKIDEKATPDTCWKMGVIFLSNGFYEDAKNRFLKAMEIDPVHLQSAKCYGITLMLLGDMEGAIAALNRAKELGPSFADIYYHLGNAYLFNKDLDQAVQGYLQALQINPRYADARLRLATACVGYILQSASQLNDAKSAELVDRSRKEAETAASLNPKVRNRSFLLAIDYLKAKKYQQAYQAFLEVRPKYVPRTGDEIVFYFNLTLLYGSEGIDLQMTEQYVEKLAKVIEEYPQYADLHHHLGVAYLIKSRFDVTRSLKEFQKALEINPQYKKAIVHSADVDDLNKRVLAVLKKTIISATASN